MKILVTGANGFLGHYLCARLLQEGFSVVATGKGGCRLPYEGRAGFIYRSLDFTRPDEVNAILREERPEALVHAGAMSRPDDCETNRFEAHRVNVLGTQYLLDAAAGLASFFVFISTDFVFDGLAGPYVETDKPSPVNYYGQTKKEAEDRVREYTAGWSIVRTVLVYGRPLSGKPNLLSIVREKLERGETYKVVCDQWRTPTYVEDLARGIVTILRRKKEGVFHLSGKEMLTPYDMALAVARRLGKDTGHLQKVDASEFRQPALRPARTGFLLHKAEKELDYFPVSFEEGLALTLGA